MIRIPNKRKSYVSSFCRKVSPGQPPILITHDPLPGKPLKECFSIVPEHIAANGGKQKFGWAVFEFKRVWLEAEFHVVWEREDGVLLDLTPREVSLDKILFIPDPERKYEGVQINSIFSAISKKPCVKKFIKLSKAFYAATNEGDLAHVQSGQIICPKAVALKQEMDELSNIIFQEHFG